MNADVIVDDLFEPRQTNAIVGQRGQRKGMIGIANVHHYLGARALFLSDHAAIDSKIDEAFVDAALRAFGAADSYFHSGLQNVRRVAGADDAGQSQLATDDGTVTGATAAIGDYRRGLFHDRLPRR